MDPSCLIAATRVHSGDSRDPLKNGSVLAINHDLLGQSDSTAVFLSNF